MATLVNAAWVAERLVAPEFILVDPRRPMKYLSGHLPEAINLPAYQAFGADGRLLEPPELAKWIASAGLDGELKPIIYDSPEGQNAALIAWLLEYLGFPDAHLMDAFFEHWKASGREVRYKPVTRPVGEFTPRVNPAVRATLAEVRDSRDARLVDFRSPEEFDGTRTLGEDRPGHLPGAVNLEWRRLTAPPEHLLVSDEQLGSLLQSSGIAKGEPVIAYCRSGPRAALGYQALRRLGYAVRLFDGSFAEWSRSALPVAP